VHQHLRHDVAHDRQVERLGHAGDLHPLADAAHRARSIMTMSTERASIMWRKGTMPQTYSPPATGV
jgi:hypothetical protein